MSSCILKFMQLKDGAITDLARLVVGTRSAREISNFLADFVDLPFDSSLGSSKVNSVFVWLKNCQEQNCLIKAILYTCDPKNYTGSYNIHGEIAEINRVLQIYGYEAFLSGVTPEIRVIDPSIQSSTEKMRHIKPNFSKISSDKIFVDILDDRWLEISDLLNTASHRMTMIAIGALLEGCFLAKMHENKPATNTAHSAPKVAGTKTVKDFKDWTLNDMINVAYDLNWIHPTRHSFSQMLRDYRNFVHPNLEARMNFRFDKQSCDLAIAVLQNVVLDLTK